MFHVIIMGGTSGIGLALARHYLSGYLNQSWQVTLVGHSLDKLASLAQEFKDNSCVQLLRCDLTCASERERLFTTLYHTPFCHFIYSAGWYFNERKQYLTPSDSERMLAINLQAFELCFLWASERLKYWQTVYPTKPYHLISIASIAGMFDFPQSSLYAKCKRSMIISCQSYYQALAPFYIGVTCIASGYVDTAQLRHLNQGSAKHKPFLISQERAVNEIMHAVAHHIPLHIFPKPMKYIAQLFNLLPKSMLSHIMSLQYKIQDKKLESKPNKIIQHPKTRNSKQ